jgi:hypothetical protein
MIQEFKIVHTQSNHKGIRVSELTADILKNNDIIRERLNERYIQKVEYILKKLKNFVQHNAKHKSLVCQSYVTGRKLQLPEVRMATRGGPMRGGVGLGGILWITPLR